MNKIQAKNMLNDVVEHFSSNPCKLRSRSKIGTCLYNPPSYKTESIGCAIGMYLKTGVAKKLDNSGSIVTIFYLPKKKALLPIWMQELDVEFLQDIQQLHDADKNWTKNGLSNNGKRSVNKIRNMFQLH